MGNPKRITNKKLNIFHLDFNFVSLRRDYIRGWLGRLKTLGFNAILWELEDKVQWETCPECVWPEALSKLKFKELLAESRSLGLEPIPLLQTVGHAEYVLQHKKYHPFRELADRHDCYCTSNAKVTKFLQTWIAEYLDLFGDLRYFHLGGDEAYVFGKCKKCSAYAAEHGRNQLFGNHIRALAEPLLQQKIRPGIWNDMIMKDPETLGLTPENYVIWDWNYWDTDRPPTRVNLHALGGYSQEQLRKSGLLNKFPELVDKKGLLRSFGSVQVLKKQGYDVILCSAARSYSDTFFCPNPIHAGNIVGAAQTVVSENLLGHCVTSWAIRLNDYTTQLPYIGLATTAAAHPGKSSATLLSEYCRELFGADPEKFIQAITILGVSLPFAQSGTTSVQWNGLKDSLPAPPGYLQKYLSDLKQSNPARFNSWLETIQKASAEIPVGVKLLAEFFTEAKQGFEIIEAWLSSARFLLATALISQRLLQPAPPRELAALLAQTQSEYAAFLRRRETPLSAEKNAGLVYDALIDYGHAGVKKLSNA